MSETDVSQLVELALNQFGDDWHRDNVNYLWIHNHWSETKDKPKPKKWGIQIRNLEQAVRNALTLRSPPLARSRSPRSPPRSLCSSLGSSSSAPDPQNLEKTHIVARLTYVIGRSTTREIRSDCHVLCAAEDIGRLDFTVAPGSG